MGAEHSIATANGWSFDELAMTTVASATYAFWSDAGGLYGVTLDADGKRAVAPRRLGDRCVGGVAAVAHGKSVAVACLRPFDGSDAAGVALLLLFGADLNPLQQRTLGMSGRVSRGIDIARSADGQLAVVWQDASLDAAEVFLWRGGDEAERLTLSTASSSPSGPSVTWLGARVFVGWAEASRDPKEKTQRLVLSRGEGPPSVITPVTYRLPTPRVRTVGGELYVSFRDLRDGVPRPGLYVSRISDQGKQVGTLARIARANARAGQTIVPCFDGLLTIAPRSAGEGGFIGINWADSTLTRRSPERQYYEDSRQFVAASGACLGDHALLLIGEQGGPTRPNAHLRSVGFRCDLP